MKKTVFIIIALTLAAAALWQGYRQYGPAAGMKAAPTDAAVAEVVIGSVESVVTAQGKLEPKEYVDVGAQVSGQIKKFHVEIGDNVKQGDPIAEIDPDVYESQVRGDEARLKTLNAQITEQKSLLAQAKSKRERNEQLLKSNAISKEVLEDAQTSENIARAKLMSLEAQIEEAQSTLEGNKANLSYTKIFAPMSGTVVSQSVKEGQTINANQTAPIIVQIANLDIMTVKAQVAEADIMKLSPEMPVYFSTLGSSSRRWQGKIRQILPSPETLNDVVLYNVLVDVKNEDHQLMTGMTTQMFFVLGKADKVPVIPTSALTKRVPEADTPAGQAYQVKMAGKNGETRTVIIGLSDRSKAAIISGLEPGEKVVLSMPQSQQQTQGGSPMRMPRL